MNKEEPDSPFDCTEGAKAAQQFTSLVRKVVRVPKEELDRRAKEWKETRKAAKAATE